MSISLDLYRVFYYVAKTGSVTRAAERLYTSQPSVSRSLRLLEDAIGCKLFDRTVRGMELTAAGETLYRYVSQGIQQINLGEEKLGQQLELESGSVCVGASDMTLKFCLLPYLERYHGLNPRVKVSVTNGPTPETLAILEQGKIDFAVVSQPVELKGDFEVRPMGLLRDVMVAGSRFSELKGRTVTLAELEKLPLVCLERNTSTRRYTDGFFAQQGVTLRPEFELATSDLIVQFALRNLGIGSVVEGFARADLDAGRLFLLNLEQEPPPRQMLLVYRASDMSEAARRFISLMLD